MKQIFVRKTYVAFLFTGMLTFSACHSSYELVGIDGGRVEINSAYDAHPDEAAVKMLAPYKAKVDSVMSPVIGHSEVAMSAERPESLLSDFSADVIRLAAIPYQGKPADVAITNMGGLRNSLPQGDVTFGNVYEIFPFENSLCLLTMNGKSLMDLFVQIAKLGGEGLSGARLVITKDGKLKDLTNCETFFVAMTGDFNNNTTVQLYTLFVTFDNTICYCNSITGFEAWVLFSGSKCFFCNFN